MKTPMSLYRSGSDYNFRMGHLDFSKQVTQHHGKFCCDTMVDQLLTKQNQKMFCTEETVRVVVF
jgi:hypothetical protein